MSRRRLVVLAAGVAFWCVAAWLGVRGAGFLWRKLSSGHAVPSRGGGAALPGGRWSASEREAIERAVRPGYRPAVTADAASTPERDDLLALYGRYDPFFVRGDLDDDGRLDFVQAFVEKGRSPLWFHVAVFFGKPDGTFEKPVWVEKAVSLADGDVTVERSLVVITPDLAGDASRRWRWEPTERVFVDPDKEPRPAVTDDDAPDETPEQKPRARI